MRWGITTALLTSAALTGVSAVGRRNPAHAGLLGEEMPRPRSPRGVPHDHWTRNGPVVKRFANDNTTQYAINGTGLPDVNFDIGEAYAGLMSIDPTDLDSNNKLYFWFQPSPNPAADKEVVIWLNGGPGCSSLEGLLQENGPFLWQYGTFLPVANPWGWHHLTNMVWVEQPIGTGFSTGTVTAVDETDVAKQFMGFWKNFINTFSMQGFKVYIAGESYAGMYVPYISSAFLDANDTTYYALTGMMVYDPSIATAGLQSDMTVVPFVDYHRNLFPFNDSYAASIHAADVSCGYAALREKYLTYPPPGPLPSPLPGAGMAGCNSIKSGVQRAVTLLNPCFDVYQVATTCPLLWDVLGFPGSFDYLPPGASIYFDRADVKAAINAPLNSSWSECGGPVFIGRDRSPPSANTVLPGVIDRTKNVIIGHGALDMILIANGTLLAIQNMTWGGKLGFQTRPIEPFYVPYHHAGADGTLAGAGVFGTAHSERGLTYVGVDLSGHMIPQYAPTASYRHLEFLLGRVDSLSSTAPFTTDSGVAQSTQPLGQGTAPQGYSNSSPCKKRKRDAVRAAA